MTAEETLKARADELEAIRLKAGGTLSPAEVVEFARNPKTALHECFTWDDGEAAEQFRLWQARQVIRICVTVRPELKEPVRVYVSLMDDRGEAGYRLLVDVLSDAEKREQLLDQALAELDRWRAKYRQLAKLAPIFAAADNVARQASRKGGGADNGAKKRLAAEKA